MTSVSQAITAGIATRMAESLAAGYTLLRRSLDREQENVLRLLDALPKTETAKSPPSSDHQIDFQA